MVDTKDESNKWFIVCAIFFVDIVDIKIKVCIALNAMFVNTVDSGVCGFYTTLYTGVKTLLYSVYKEGSCPSRREGLYSLPSCGSSCSEEAALLTF